MVLVAKIGATVAAATGVPVLKMVFCGDQTQSTELYAGALPTVQSKRPAAPTLPGPQQLWHEPRRAARPPLALT